MLIANPILDSVFKWLLGINTAITKIGRKYIDLQTKEAHNSINEFIEQLTHDSYIVQIPLIEGKLCTRLGTLLSFFEQSHFIDDAHMYKEYPYPIDDETAQLIANELNFAVMDSNKRKILEIEREAYRVINVNRAETKEKNKN